MDANIVPAHPRRDQNGLGRQEAKAANLLGAAAGFRGLRRKRPVAGLRLSTRPSAGLPIEGQVSQHGLAGFLGLGERFKRRAADLDGAPVLMDRTPRRHETGMSVKAGTAAARVTDREREAVAARGPYFQVLDGTSDAGELHGHSTTEPVVGWNCRRIKRSPKHGFKHDGVAIAWPSPAKPAIARQAGPKAGLGSDGLLPRIVPTPDSTTAFGVVFRGSGQARRVLSGNRRASGPFPSPVQLQDGFLPTQCPRARPRGPSSSLCRGRFFEVNSSEGSVKR